jgi:hypothetical protein
MHKRDQLPPQHPHHTCTANSAHTYATVAHERRRLVNCRTGVTLNLKLTSAHHVRAQNIVNLAMALLTQEDVTLISRVSGRLPAQHNLTS